MIRKVLTAAILLIIIPFIHIQTTEKAGQQAEQVHAAQVADIGSQAPEFSLSSLDGKEKRLSDYKGKMVLINFWATWCPPCKAEMPAMQKLSEKTTGNLEILAINIDPQNDVAGFANEKSLTFPILFDKTGAINESYSVISIPTTFLVNEEGVIEKKQIGAMTLEQMEEFIESL